MLRKVIVKVWKIFRKASVMEFILAKLEAYSVQTATLVLAESTADPCSCLKKNFSEKSYGAPVSIKDYLCYVACIVFLIRTKYMH